MNAQISASVRYFLLAVIFIAPTQLFAAAAAKVEFVLGSAFAVTASGEKRELAKGSSIEVGDTVISEDARVQLRFTDGGFVSLAPHSEFRVNAYSYSGKPDGSEQIAMELMKGGLRTISGLIGKAIQSAYEMKTSAATMGIRGTEYTVVYGDSVSGTVSAGAIAVCNAGGCLDVPKGKSYYVADVNTKPVFINKAAFLPPPQPVNVARSKNPAETKGQATLSRGNTPFIAKNDRDRKNDEPQLTKGYDNSEDKKLDSGMSQAAWVQQKQSEQALKAFELRDSSHGVPVNGSGSLGATGSVSQTSQVLDDGIPSAANLGKGKLK